MKKFFQRLGKNLGLFRYNFRNEPPTPPASWAMCQLGGVTL